MIEILYRFYINGEILFYKNNRSLNIYELKDNSAFIVKLGCCYIFPYTDVRNYCPTSGIFRQTSMKKEAEDNV